MADKFGKIKQPSSHGEQPGEKYGLDSASGRGQYLRDRPISLPGKRRAGESVRVGGAGRRADERIGAGISMRAKEKPTGRSESSREKPMPLLRLFAYGTLKRGCRNHHAFCRGFVEIREASVRGRLYQGPGYPILEVPEEDILAQGTTHPLADAATQARLSDPVRSKLQRFPESATGDPWGAVYGELLTFDDPQTRLPPIDRLEGFRPAGRSLYRRVQVRATVDGARQLAWVYTVENLGIGRRRIESGRWPE